MKKNVAFIPRKHVFELFDMKKIGGTKIDHRLGGGGLGGKALTVGLKKISKKFRAENTQPE